MEIEHPNKQKDIIDGKYQQFKLEPWKTLLGSSCS